MLSLNEVNVANGKFWDKWEAINLKNSLKIAY